MKMPSPKPVEENQGLVCPSSISQPPQLFVGGEKSQIGRKEEDAARINDAINGESIE
jgi:hypothetical protein